MGMRKRPCPRASRPGVHGPLHGLLAVRDGSHKLSAAKINENINLQQMMSCGWLYMYQAAVPDRHAGDLVL